MRLGRVYIDGFKNLKNVEIDFDKSRLTTVVIGQNGAGKSNLIEAIADIFRYVDMNRSVPRFDYQIDYRIGDHDVTLFNREGKQEIIADGTRLNRKAFDTRQHELFPDMVFGYYSGGSRRLERLFDSHQRRYYDAIKTNNDPQECLDALTARRLFYCRPIHGVFALLAFFANRTDSVTELLKEHLGVTGFDSALVHLREPWFAKGGQKAKLEKARDIWGAEGPAGTCARRLRDCAFHPLVVRGNAIDDYRDKQQVEAQLGAFLRNKTALSKFAKPYSNDHDLFYALEAMDISDIIRELHLWVTRVDDASGDVSFADLSDGERQLLMVLGLIRVARGRRALFLLDEPDTHLNPLWQHTYLQLIQEWTGVAADAADCQFILTSHNPLTIAALEKEDVRVMHSDKAGRVSVSAPYTDPRGMGFTATLTEVFGLPTTVDRETQQSLDERNRLAQIDRRTKKQEKQLLAINDTLNRLGFMFEDREPLYSDFLRAWRDVRYADRPPLSPEEIDLRRKAMSELVKELISKKQSAP